MSHHLPSEKTVNLGKKGSFKEHPGALHRALHVPIGQKIPEKKLEGHHSGHLGHMIASAKGFKAMHHGDHHEHHQSVHIHLHGGGKKKGFKI